MIGPHGEGPDLYLDARLAEVGGERPLGRKQDERRVARRIKPARDQVKLSIGSVAPARGMDEQDARGTGLHLDVDRQCVARRALD